MDRKFIDNIPIVRLVLMKDYLKFKYGIDIHKLGAGTIYLFFDEYKDFCVSNKLSYEKDYEIYWSNLSKECEQLYIEISKLRNVIKHLQTKTVQDDETAERILELRNRISRIRRDEHLRSL